ncbi:MAG: histidinol-phosphatase [Legionella sp.]|uniref:histidinol-phosphatase n=1 Tax=Legionella sp. TaxID=459 RepID=UPI0039E36378
MLKQKILFIDRDGTLIDEPADKQIDSLEKLELEPGVIPALLRLKSLGYRFVMLSNQDGLGSNQYPQVQFDSVQEKLLSLLNSQGITFDAIHICPHWESDGCECRKPNLGLVLDYLAMPDLDRQRSYVIGDRETDCLLAEKMRLKGFLYHKERNGWSSIVAQIEDKNRVASFQRKTSETMIQVDEAIVEVSGRPYFIYDGEFSRERVGDLPTEMVSHFFQSLAHALKATLYLRMRGSNAHHQVESLFKGFGRAFHDAKQCDGIGIPSTKGIL